jgi:2-polyprenyl-3-methyl-5-hydroxy-6-metoxy-1,4-benzoquinol methylase
MAECAICKSHSAAILGRHPDFDTIQIARCAGCGMVSVNPLPTREELADRYRMDYRSVRQETATVDYLNFMDERAAAQNAFITKEFRPGDRISVLDIGCSAGSLLRSFDQTADLLTGYEPDVAMAGVARTRLPGATIRTELCDPAALPTDAYDLITLSHVLEHVIEPTKYLSQLLRAVRPTGRIFVEVPNEPLIEIERLIQAKYQGHMHLSFFTPDTFRRCVAASGGIIVLDGTFGPRTDQYSGVPKHLLARRQTLPERTVRRVARVVQRLSNRTPPPVLNLRDYMAVDQGNNGIWIRVLIARSK